MTAGVISFVEASRLCVSVFRNRICGFLTPPPRNVPVWSSSTRYRTSDQYSCRQVRQQVSR